MSVYPDPPDPPTPQQIPDWLLNVGEWSGLILTLLFCLILWAYWEVLKSCWRMASMD